MSSFFSGAVTSSPIKRRLRGNDSCRSLDHSLLSPDSSYVCYSSPGGDASCCRRSPRLLTNGYYAVTEESFRWDERGNVSLTPGAASVSYKENLVRVFRRRRRPRGSLARLLSGVTESCQTWLDETVFRGVFGTGRRRVPDPYKDLEPEYEPRPGAGPAPLDLSSWSGPSGELDDGHRSFTYDPTEAPPPPDKTSTPAKRRVRVEICADVCQSKEQIAPAEGGGLSEVPPPSAFHAHTCCCRAPAESTGLTAKALLLLLLAVFVASALYSRCVWRSTAVATCVFITMATCMLVTKSGPLGEWRRAKTEDITSRNE